MQLPSPAIFRHKLTLGVGSIRGLTINILSLGISNDEEAVSNENGDLLSISLCIGANGHYEEFERSFFLSPSLLLQITRLFLYAHKMDYNLYFEKLLWNCSLKISIQNRI